MLRACVIFEGICIVYFAVLCGMYVLEEVWDMVDVEGVVEVALERFKTGIAKLEEENEGQTILVITHGTVLTLYFAEQTGKWERIFDRWKRLPFCAIGLVENGKVVKDLGQKSLVRHFEIGKH